MSKNKPGTSELRGVLFYALLFVASTMFFSSTSCQSNSRVWHTQTNIYQIFVEKFSASRDLEGVRNGLDYIQKLGVKTIWMMPIFEAMDDHGYNVTNYYKIAARYGTNQKLKDLTTEAHNKNIRILLDLVINHTGTMHPWFASADPQVRKDGWYIWADRDQKWNDPWNSSTDTGEAQANKTWFKDPFPDYDRDGDGNIHNDDYYYSVFGDGTAELKDTSTGKIVGYGSTMPDLNFNDPVARNEIVAEVKKIMDYWIKNTGVDGFRCDAVRYLTEVGPGNQADQPETHAIWKELRKWLDTNHPGVILLAEAPTEEYSQMLKYYGDGNEFQNAFHFKFQGLLMTPAKAGYRPNGFMNELYEIQGHLPKNTQDVLFLSNHDQFAGDRVASQLNDDSSKIKLAASLYLLLSGNPAIYYGEEIGMTGANNDADLRQPLNWDVINSQLLDENSILNHYRRLLKLRNTYAALRGGITYFTHAHYSSDNWWDNNSADEQIHASLDSTGLFIPDETPAYSLMGNSPVETVSSTNRNWYNIGTVYPKCSRVVFFGDISKYQNRQKHYITYENALSEISE